MIAYAIPPGVSASTQFRVRLDGVPVDVASTGKADFVTLATAGGVRVEVTVPDAVRKVDVRPHSKGVLPVVDGHTVSFTLTRPMHVCVEITGLPPLFVFANPLPADRPDPRDPAVHYFAAGAVHDVGTLRLKSGETLYIEGGAVVRGAVHAVDAENIRIGGQGIMDGSAFAARVVTLEHCRNVIIEDLVLIRPSTWMIVLGACDQVVVRNIKEIGEVVCSDGVDVVGCRDVLIEDCFLANNDDCVVIKAKEAQGAQARGERDWRQNVARVRTRRCTLLNWGAGNIMEIGFELQADVVEDIVFEDIDVIGAHVYAAVFSIHNGDRATVRNVRYENIRVEHYWNKLVDFRILNSRYSRDAERGQIRDVLLKNIRCVPNTHNTPSLIGGFDATHTVENVVFQDVFFGERQAVDGDDLHLFVKQAKGIVFQ